MKRSTDWNGGSDLRRHPNNNYQGCHTNDRNDEALSSGLGPRAHDHGRNSGEKTFVGSRKEMEEREELIAPRGQTNHKKPMTWLERIRLAEKKKKKKR